MGTCIQHGDLFYSAGLHRNRCLPRLTQEKKLGRRFRKMQVNGPEGARVCLVCRSKSSDRGSGGLPVAACSRPLTDFPCLSGVQVKEFGQGKGGLPSAAGSRPLTTN